MARGILLLSALLFAGFGAAFTLFPHRLAATVGIQLTTSVARTDFAATYGGFELGFAVFLAICASRPAWVRPGLVASGCAIAGFASVRLVGILIAPELSLLMVGVLIFEAAGSALSFWALSFRGGRAAPE